jgi:phage tail-like protein
VAISSVVESSLKAKLVSTPNNYGVTHIAIGSIPGTVAWSNAKLVRKYSGYPQNINDGDTIYEFNNTDYIVKVDSINGSGGITAVSNANINTFVAAPVAATGVEGTTVVPSLGSGATFGVLSTSGTVTITTSGTGYAVNDLVTIRIGDLKNTSEIDETSEPNEYGLSGVRHLYDVLGTTTAVAINPGVVSASAGAQENSPVKTYYALFVKYVNSYTTSTVNTGRIWKKIGESSSVVVKEQGTVNTLIKHLPSFYSRDSQTDAGNDLVDFLRVFAFQLDMYKAQSLNVLYNTNITSSDETLLKLLLKELGVPFANVGDISQARTLVANIIKIYKESGSLIGLETLIEAYTGYGSNIIVGRNLISDYNSSSFEENTGFWNPFPFTYTSTKVPRLTSVGPVDGGVVAFSDAASGYGRIDNTVTSASCLTTSTTVTGNFNSDLKVGSLISVVSASGTGVLATGTVVTSILSTNTFRINYPPITALSGANLRASKNMSTGMGKLNFSAPFFYTLGIKRAPVFASAVSTTNITVAPYLAEVNDYVIFPTIPYGTYVVSASSPTASSQNIVLSNPVSLSTSDSLTLSRNSAESTGAGSTLLPVKPGYPYAFSMFLNSGTSVTGTTVATANATILWRQRSLFGGLSPSATGPNSEITISVANGTTNKWIPVVAQGVAPANALYAELRITGGPSGSFTNWNWYLDAVQFEGPITVVKKEIPTSTTVKLTTETQHNFSTTLYGFSGPNYVTVTGLGSPYDGTFPIAAINTPTSFTYTISSTSTAPESAVVGGLVASNTPYEDARKTIIDVLPNRVNLVTNPSFELDTVFWGTSTNASSSSGVNCHIGTTTTANFGVGSLKLTASTAAPMSVYGHAGTIVSGVITNYETPFKIDRSNVTEESFYTLSFYTQAASTARNCYAEIYWYKDEAGTVASDIKVKEVGASAPNSTTGWARYQVTGRAPEDAVSAKVEVHVIAGTSGEVHYLDNVLFEKGYSTGAYFDGNFDGQNYTDDRDSMWETGGIPNKCRSHFYLNKVSNTGRLKTTLTDGLYYA